MANGDNNFQTFQYFVVEFGFAVKGDKIIAGFQNSSHRAHWGASWPVAATSGISGGGLFAPIGQTSPASGTEITFFYPRWGSGQYRKIDDESDSFVIGTASSTSLAVTNSCARIDVVSSDLIREYAALVRY